MMRKIITASLLFILGVSIAFFVEPYLNQCVVDLFQWTTNNRIVFSGKHFYIFLSSFYYLSFGISFIVLFLGLKNENRFWKFINPFVSLFIFILSLVFISWFSAILKLATCTMCNEEVFFISYGSVRYGLIIGVAILVSTVPRLIKLIYRKIKSK
jgi:hypothetical protein